jgi:hypothetical protein
MTGQETDESAGEGSFRLPKQRDVTQAAQSEGELDGAIPTDHQERHQEGLRKTPGPIPSGGSERGIGRGEGSEEESGTPWHTRNLPGKFATPLVKITPNFTLPAPAFVAGIGGHRYKGRHTND